ncbi:hypothetical protein Salat_2405200 [Sesamum alatum]|uniref:Uncharacterized protein n=1 Tax=Sesamum alatum TaxID=300844 RepID=A0AAE1XYP9_9LAMI|nr:hypothetical protein Salat_2405200 [Sesamum alatum]
MVEMSESSDASKDDPTVATATSAVRPEGTTKVVAAGATPLATGRRGPVPKYGEVAVDHEHEEKESEPELDSKDDIKARGRTEFNRIEHEIKRRGREHTYEEAGDHDRNRAGS